MAALTFDDGPNPGETDALLDFLAQEDLTAVFCVIGQNITAPLAEGWTFTLPQGGLPDPENLPSITTERVVRAGEELDVRLTGFTPGTAVHLSLESQRGTRPTTTTHLGDVTVGADGSVAISLPVGRALKGVHTLMAQSEDVHLDERVVVRRAPTAAED